MPWDVKPYNLLTFQRKAFFCKFFTGFHAVTTQKTKVYSHGSDNLKYHRSSEEYPTSFKVRNKVPKLQAIPQCSQFYLAILKTLLLLLSLSWLLTLSRYVLVCLMCFMLSWLLHFGSFGRLVHTSQIRKSTKLMLAIPNRRRPAFRVTSRGLTFIPIFEKSSQW